MQHTPRRCAHPVRWDEPLVRRRSLPSRFTRDVITLAAVSAGAGTACMADPCQRLTSAAYPGRPRHCSDIVRGAIVGARSNSPPRPRPRYRQRRLHLIRAHARVLPVRPSIHPPSARTRFSTLDLVSMQARARAGTAQTRGLRSVDTGAWKARRGRCRPGGRLRV